MSSERVEHSTALYILTGTTCNMTSVPTALEYEDPQCSVSGRFLLMIYTALLHGTIEEHRVQQIC